MEIQFTSDFKHNYLTISATGSPDSFTVRMLSENMIPGFLCMEQRNLDGEIIYYYDISGRQSMKLLFGDKKIGRQEFQELMWNLHGVIEQSQEFFLPGNGICVLPELLFWNMEKRAWEFVYIPGRAEMEQADLQREKEELAEFLVMQVDYEDRRLADMAYQFYEEVTAGRFFPEKYLIQEESAWPEKEGESKMVMQEPERELLLEERREETEAEDDRTENFLSNKEKEKPEKRQGIKIILLLLIIAAAALTFYYYSYFSEALVTGGVIIFIMTGALLLIHTGKGKKPCDEAEVEWKEEEENTDIQIWEDMEEKKDTEEYTEKTVYMEMADTMQKKLYGVGKYRQQKISLEKLPCTVGKEKSLADYILSDASVSRVHARFFMEGEKVWMQDMNSTNGTCHNGFRLRPNEKVELEPEDEICLGKVQFVYR